MTDERSDDLSNGYEAITRDYLAARSATGRDLIASWAAALPAQSRVLDLGAGFGEPVTSELIKAGHTVSAIEAAPSMVAEFQRRFPDIRIACEGVEESDFFLETFDAVCAVGLIFLLPAREQQRLIERVSDILAPGGAFLFSAPLQTGRWEDVLTGRESVSLGEADYRATLSQVGFTRIDGRTDEGGSHYYLATLR